MVEMNDAPSSHLQLALLTCHSLPCSAPHQIFIGPPADHQHVSPKDIPKPRPVRTAEPFGSTRESRLIAEAIGTFSISGGR